MPRGTQRRWSLSRPPHRRNLTGRGRVCVLLLVGMLLGYGLPFYGFWLSIAVPAAMQLGGQALWGAAAPRRPFAAGLTWIGLWLPAVSYYLTGWYWELTGRDLSTAWLLIPLCGPENIIVGTVVPALAATAVFAAGVGASILSRMPWLVVLAAWLVPWAHELVFNAVVADVTC